MIKEQKNRGKPKTKQMSTGYKNKKSGNPKKKQARRKYNAQSIPSPSYSKKIVLVFWNLLFYGSMLFILISAGLMAMMQQQNKSLNGYRMFGVLTNSMVSPDNTIKKGGFRSGDIIVTKETDPKAIRVGDVITYRPSTNPTNESTNNLTHRVVKILDQLGEEEGTFFVTQGDANKTEDMPISSTALVGKEVLIIPKLGGVLAFVKDNWLISIIFILCLVGFIWVMRTYILPVPSLQQPLEKRRKKKKRPKISQPKRPYSTHGITSKEDNIKKQVKNRRKHT